MVSQSEHTEPSRQHTYDELMHPGRHHHASNSEDAPFCPDPSMHKNTKLQEQASTAALYATSPERKKEPLLDKDNKLSSKSAATSLKYAQPMDLPGFPVVGINTANSANSAANLANDNQKPFEHWKPDASASASKAAMLAKDYKMAPLWKPELSAAGSKAALLAARDGGKVDLWMPEATAEGNSAATQAMRNKGLSPNIDFGYTDDGRKRAMMAATGALGRSRSGSTPTPALPVYPDSANAKSNALSAATFASRPSTRVANTDSSRMSSEAMEASRITHIGSNIPREMWGERPPVQLEVDEKNHNAALRASAVSMAKQMYDAQQRKAAQPVDADMGGSAARAVHGRAPSVAEPADLKTQAMQYIHLQEAAQKLANERLAKLDPDGSARYRAHYGYPTQAPKSRLSMRGRQRLRAGSESQKGEDDSSDDEFQSRRIRNQMSKMNQDLAAVDAAKRKTDRAALLAAAEKKVHAQMHAMDESVFAETGKVSPAMMEEWEAKARAKATADSANRQQNFGKTHIGGGRYMDQSEIEAIAAARLKPTLDEISDTAEKKRARDEEIRLEMEEKKRQEQTEKMREREVKYFEKRTRDEEKAEAKTKKQQEKNAARIEKDAEKARLAEEKRSSKVSKQRTDEAKDDAAAVTASKASKPETTSEPAIVVTDEEPKTPVMSDTPNLERLESPISISSPEGGLHPSLERHVTHIGDSDDDEQSSANEIAGANEIAERVMSAPVVDVSGTTEPVEPTITAESEAAEPALATAPTAATTTSTSPAVVGEPAKSSTDVDPPRANYPNFQRENKKDSGRLSGFFSRFKSNRKSTAVDSSKTAKDSMLTEPSTTATTSATVTNPAEDGKALSPNEALASTAGVEDNDAGSVSSFRRHETDLHSISSISSDEADAVRGREGKETAPGGATLGGVGLTKQVTNDDEDDDGDEFEEARDTFDETLAPPPSFGGQAKSSSPVRETKFVEEL